MPTGRRCFVAITLANDVRDALSGVQRKLSAEGKDAGATVEIIPRRYLHITLEDLGRCPPDSEEAVSLTIDRLLSAHAPFKVSFRGLAAFPQSDAPRLIYATIDDNKGRLAAFRAALHEALLKYGFDVDPRPFHPHVALARVDGTFGPLGPARPNLPEVRVRNIGLFRETPIEQKGPRFERTWTQTLVRFPPKAQQYPGDAALDAEITQQLDARLAHHAATTPRGRRRRPAPEV